jgi:signal transduction histidine kinase
MAAPAAGRPGSSAQLPQRVMLTLSRGLLQAAVALPAGIGLLIACALAVAVIPLGVGLVAVPAAFGALRRLADRERDWAQDWTGVTIGDPYRPDPARAARTAQGGGTGRGGTGRLRRCRWLLTDPATWRDLLWLVLNIPASLVAGLLPMVMIAYGLLGVITVMTQSDSIVAGPLWLHVVILAAGPVAAMALQRGRAEFSRVLLAPTRAALQTRVSRLTGSRTQAVDASAAELRRIERDLHDGAQARLAALGMSIGLAEDLITDDPGQARALLAEARESSGQALAELRDLVRGIYPPVLAERGLDGAVRALALTLPLPVDVRVELPGRAGAPVESAAYFAVAESLANVVKHAGARRAWVRLQHTRDRLLMTVGDDGAGGADPGSGSGLRGIERRLAAFDGTITVTSPAAGPTVVTMELPCELSSVRISPSSGTG